MTNMRIFPSVDSTIVASSREPDQMDESPAGTLNSITGLPEDVPAYNRPGVSDETLQKAGIRHVAAEDAYELCGLREPGLWMPYLNIKGNAQTDNDQPFGTLRLDSPKDDRKYHQRVGTRPHIGIPPGVGHMDMSGGLTIVEGYFKALSLTEAGFPAVGITGFYGFKNKGADGQDVLPPELEEVLDTLKPGKIYFCGDTDTAFNYQFSDAAVRLAKLLARGIHCPRLPVDGPGKGVDDCRGDLGEYFASWLRARLGDAVPVTADTDPKDLTLVFLDNGLAGFKRLRGAELDKSQKGVAGIGAMLRNDPVRYKRLCDLCKRRGGVLKGDLERMVNEQIAVSAAKNAEDSFSRLRVAIGEDTYDLLVDEQGPPFTLTNKGAVASLNQVFFVKMFSMRQQILFSPDEKAFFEYEPDTGLWVEVTDDYVRDLLATELVKVGESAGLKDDVAGMRTYRLLDDFMKLLRGSCQDDDPWKCSRSTRHVHSANRILDFSSSQLISSEFAPSWRSRNRVPIAYDPQATCPRFLGEVLTRHVASDDISFLQRSMGLMLIGGNPTQQVTILEGEGGLGKGLLTNVLKGVLGDENCVELRTDQLDGRFEIGRYASKRLLIGPDVPCDFLRHRGAERVKALVGGDTLEAEKKGSNRARSIRGHFDVIITTNSRLGCRIDGDVSAWRRRLRIIEFTGEPPAKPIPDFDRVLIDEEGPGILAWMVEGLKAALAELDSDGRLRLTDEQKARVDNLLAESESVEAFVRTCLKQQDKVDISCMEAAVSYSNMCAEKGWIAVPDRDLNRRLREAIRKEFGIGESHSIERDCRHMRGWRNLTVKPRQLGV